MSKEKLSEKILKERIFEKVEELREKIYSLKGWTFGSYEEFVGHLHFRCNDARTTKTMIKELNNEILCLLQEFEFSMTRFTMDFDKTPNEPFMRLLEISIDFDYRFFEESRKKRETRMNCNLGFGE